MDDLTSEVLDLNFGNVGDRTPPEVSPKRPKRILLIGDFSGRAAKSSPRSPDEWRTEKVLNVDFDNFEDVLARLAPSLTIEVGDTQKQISLEFESMDDFHPDQLYQKVGVFKQLAQLRKQLNDPKTFDAALKKLKAGAEKHKVSLGHIAKKTRAKGARVPVKATSADFKRLLGGKTVSDKSEIDVDTFLSSAIGPFIQAMPDSRKEAVVQAVDLSLTDAMNSLLHHADFQALESTWLGLDFLIRRLELSTQLQVEIFDLTVEELVADLSADEDLSNSSLFHILGERPFEKSEGGFSLVCGLYDFEMTPPHAELLGRLSKIAMHAGARFVTGIEPDQVSKSDKQLHPLQLQAWSALTQLPEANALCLVTPGFVLRQPYGKKTDPISSFAYEEFSRDNGLRSFLWGHPSLLVACVLGRSFKELKTSVGELPFFYVVDSHNDQVALPCTKRYFSVDMASHLARRCVAAVVCMKGMPEVRLTSLMTVGGEPLPLLGTAPVMARTSVATSTTIKSKEPPPTKGKKNDEGEEDEFGGLDSESEDSSSEFSFDSDSDSDSDSSSDDFSFGDDSDSGSSSSDSDLDSLLSSLDSDDSSSDSGGSDEMDLDALLASLS
jgi:type VI secretion system protein ImpC